MCKTNQPHKWQQSKISNRTSGRGCPYDSGKAVCPCNDLAHNHPEVAAEWDWEANGERTPETVAASSHTKAAWRCGLWRCGHRWSASIGRRTQGTGCPQCGREASRIKTRQPSISSGAPHLLAEWDWEANGRCGWHPDRVTLGSAEAGALGRARRVQAGPSAQMAGNTMCSRVGQKTWLPLPIWHFCVCLQLPGCAVPRGSRPVGPSAQQGLDPS